MDHAQKELSQSLGTQVLYSKHSHSYARNSKRFVTFYLRHCQKYTEMNFKNLLLLNLVFKSAGPSYMYIENTLVLQKQKTQLVECSLCSVNKFLTACENNAILTLPKFK